MKFARLRILFFIAVAVVMVGATKEKAPEIQCEWSGVERIVAVGDIHGDLDQFVKCLRAAKVVDTNNTWIAGKTHLVQVGDAIDRGTNSCGVLDLMMDLEKQAEKAGGKVHALIGNHEAMALAGYYLYIREQDMKAYGGEARLRKLMSPEGKYGKWIRGHNAVIKINDSIFVHAGVTGKDARKTLLQLNNGIRDALKRPAPQDFPAQEIYWTRVFDLPDKDDATARAGPAMETYDPEVVVPALKAYTARRMVIGHNVHLTGIRTRSNGRLVQIDVGMSKVYGGKAECLVIEKDKLYAVSQKGKKKL